MSAAPPRKPPRAAPAGLADLKALKRRMDAAAQAEAAVRAAQQARAATLAHERELFLRSVGPVTPLKRAVRTPIARALPEPVPLQRQLDEQAALREALSDDFDVESLLDTDDALSFRRPGVGIEVVRKLRRGGWSIQAQVDLHGLRRDEAREQLGGFLRLAGKQGLRCVRVVHGKGNGSPGKQAVLKAKVHSWLVQKNEVMAFVQARAAEGGAGALVVLLRSRPEAAAEPAPRDKPVARRY